MKRVIAGAVGFGLMASMGMAAAVPSSAQPAPPATTEKAEDHREHELTNPLEDKRRALRDQAVTAVLNGEAKPETRNGSKVVKVGESAVPADASTKANARAQRAGSEAGSAKGKKRDQYVELSQERADKVFVILAEFGDKRHPDFPDADTDPGTPGPEVFDGPRHNQIPEPDRSEDNATNWQADYDREHYDDVYFADGKKDESVKTYYETQSSGRYTIDGEVADWVTVKYNAARYGREDATTWNLIQDAVNQWVRDQRASGKTLKEIRAAVREYDQWDRYDFDGDGDFNEPDGYIDHFQIVHAGAGEEDGGGQQGEDAIWSHRWYAWYTDQGITGPGDNLLGGTQIGKTGVWIGDYTVQPENGGLSVFVHEYGHDLGLPDAYNTGAGGDNSNEYWTLMAQSRLNAKGEALGTRPGDLGAWEKLQLGWLDYEVIATDQKKTLELGPQEYNSAKPQGAVVVLPDKEVSQELGAPASGEMQFHSGSGDDLSNSMTTEVDLTGQSGAELTAQVRYDIEAGYDYLYTQVSTDGGDSWTSLEGTVGGDPIGTDTSGTPAIDGTQESWADMVVPLGAYDGQQIQLRFLYRTDGGVAPIGFFADDIVVSAGGEELVADGAEGETVFDLDGFRTIGAADTQLYDNYYVMGHRSYVSYDKYLKTGPYNFGWADTRPDFVEHYQYGQGLLISYWDTSMNDNDTVTHPGQGRNLPIDANPEPITNIVTGDPWRARIQVYDAPFGLKKAKSMTLHTNGDPSYIRARDAQPVFDDRKKYWYAELPNHGVKLPAVGVRVRVLEQKGTSMKVRFN